MEISDVYRRRWGRWLKAAHGPYRKPGDISWYFLDFSLIFWGVCRMRWGWGAGGVSRPRSVQVTSITFRSPHYWWLPLQKLAQIGTNPSWTGQRCCWAERKSKSSRPDKLKIDSNWFLHRCCTEFQTLHCRGDFKNRIGKVLDALLDLCGFWWISFLWLTLPGLIEA